MTVGRSGGEVFSVASHLAQEWSEERHKVYSSWRRMKHKNARSGKMEAFRNGGQVEQ